MGYFTDVVKCDRRVIGRVLQDTAPLPFQTFQTWKSKSAEEIKLGCHVCHDLAAGDAQAGSATKKHVDSRLPHACSPMPALLRRRRRGKRFSWAQIAAALHERLRHVKKSRCHSMHTPGRKEHARAWCCRLVNTAGRRREKKDGEQPGGTPRVAATARACETKKSRDGRAYHAQNPKPSTSITPASFLFFSSGAAWQNRRPSRTMGYPLHHRGDS